MERTHVICRDVIFGFYEQKLDETCQEYHLCIKAPKGYVRLNLLNLEFNLKVYIPDAIGYFNESHTPLKVLYPSLDITIYQGLPINFLIEAMSMQGSAPLLNLSKLITFFVFTFIGLTF